MKNLATRFFVLAFPVMLSGCVSTGVFNAVNVTNIELSTGNFRVIATNVHGEASAGYLFGFSVAAGSEMRTFAFIRVQGDGLLYKAALENLWRNFEQQYGSVEGRSLALVNVRYDSDAMNVFFVYTRPKISVRADVIEFESS